MEWPAARLIHRKKQCARDQSRIQCPIMFQSVSSFNPWRGTNPSIPHSSHAVPLQVSQRHEVSPREREPVRIVWRSPTAELMVGMYHDIQLAMLHGDSAGTGEAVAGVLGPADFDTEICQAHAARPCCFPVRDPILNRRLYVSKPAAYGLLLQRVQRGLGSRRKVAAELVRELRYRFLHHLPIRTWTVREGVYSAEEQLLVDDPSCPFHRPPLKFEPPLLDMLREVEGAQRKAAGTSIQVAVRGQTDV